MKTSGQLLRAKSGADTLPDNIVSGGLDQSRLCITGTARLTVAQRAPTATRIQNMRKLIEHMFGRTLSLGEIALHLKFSDAGARKYVRELSAVGILATVPDPDGSVPCVAKALFSVTDCTQRIEEGLAEIASNAALDATKAATSVAKRLGRDASGNRRKFHVLDDDETFAVHISRHVPQRDPLVAALFGPPVGQIMTAR